MFGPLVLLSYVRNMENLAPTASLGNIVYIYTIVVIFYQGFSYSCCIPMDEIKLSDVNYFPFVFGSLSFALEGIALVLPIKHRMKDQKQFPMVMYIAFTILFIAYLGFSLFWFNACLSYSKSLLNLNLSYPPPTSSPRHFFLIWVPTFVAVKFLSCRIFHWI